MAGPEEMDQTACGDGCGRQPARLGDRLCLGALDEVQDVSGT